LDILLLHIIRFNTHIFPSVKFRYSHTYSALYKLRIKI